MATDKLRRRKLSHEVTRCIVTYISNELWLIQTLIDIVSEAYSSSTKSCELAEIIQEIRIKLHNHDSAFYGAILKQIHVLSHPILEHVLTLLPALDTFFKRLELAVEEEDLNSMTRILAYEGRAVVNMSWRGLGTICEGAKNRKGVKKYAREAREDCERVFVELRRLEERGMQ
ncbi:hypothetical protein J7L81_02370 [Candidatus Aerophobetes bacterium]|nr:hypothetical protein [Candidatus Aerophobetes bacterium]